MHTVHLSLQVLVVSALVLSGVGAAVTTSSVGPDATDFLFPYLWHLHNYGTNPEAISGEDINIIPAWEGEGERPGVTGAGINIAVIDTGVQLDHPDLVNHIALVDPLDPANPARLDLDLLDGDDNAWPELGPPPSEALDDHGTLAAGVAAAEGFNGIGMRGVAYDAGIIPIRMIWWDVTTGTDAQRQTAFTHRLHENTPESPGSGIVHVSNNSWFPYSWEELAPMGPLARQGLVEGTSDGRGGLGVVYVFAAGHGRFLVDHAESEVDVRYGDVNYNGFASSRYTIAAGSCDGAGFPAFYSEPGAALMVNAPSTYLINKELGEVIYYDLDLIQLFSTTIPPSAFPPDEYEETDPERLFYSEVVGGNTSATAQVSGAVAMMLEMNPNLGWRDVQHIIARTSEPSGPPLPSSAPAPNAVFDPAVWQQNGAGLWFNHDLGFGRIDVTAAVTMAQDWVNLLPATPITVNHVETTQIPDNDENGITQTVDVDNPQGMQVEHVEVTITGIDHIHMGDLEIVLVSPSGTQSLLTAMRPENSESYRDHLFTTVVNWGEDPEGTWGLRISDLSSFPSFERGNLTSWTMTIYGNLDPTLVSGIATE